MTSHAEQISSIYRNIGHNMAQSELLSSSSCLPHSESWDQLGYRIPKLEGII